ncbi:unnamed protein product, partial [Mesorhabditis spiculigera]
MRTIAPRVSPRANQKTKPTKTKSQRLSAAEKIELDRLAAILPPVARLANPGRDPLRVLHDTAAYIDNLVQLVEARVARGTLSPDVLAQFPTARLPRATAPRKPRRKSLEKKP